MPLTEMLVSYCFGIQRATMCNIQHGSDMGYGLKVQHQQPESW